MRDSVLEIYKWIAIIGLGSVTLYVVFGLLIDQVKAEQAKIAKINKRALRLKK